MNTTAPVVTTTHPLNTKPPWFIQTWENTARTAVKERHGYTPRPLTVPEAQAAFDLIDNLRRIVDAARKERSGECNLEAARHQLDTVINPGAYRTHDQLLAEKQQQEGDDVL